MKKIYTCDLGDTVLYEGKKVWVSSISFGGNENKEKRSELHVCRIMKDGQILKRSPFPIGKNWKHLVLILLLLVISSCSMPTKKPIESVTPPKIIKKAGDKWVLKWSDEFNGGNVNRENWTFEEGLIRNEELQYYTDREKNARIENGFLIIEAHKENYEGAEYTSASISTRYLHSFRYGKIEIFAKLPQGKGVWPAFWTTGDNYKQVKWPKCGEIDIMEYLGRTPDYIYSTIHYEKSGVHISTGKSYKIKNGFHLYSIEWSEKIIKFFVDSVNFFNFDIDIIALQLPHILRANLAIGGSWGGSVNDSIFPQKYIIDYIRVFKLVDQRNLINIYNLLLLK